MNTVHAVRYLDGKLT